MSLTRDQILSAQDLKTETVQVPEWGGEIIVRTMTGSERDAFEEYVYGDGKRNFAAFRARMVSLCAVDEAGNRLFTDADVEALGKKSAKALDRVLATARRLNAITEEDVNDLVKK